MIAWATSKRSVVRSTKLNHDTSSRSPAPTPCATGYSVSICEYLSSDRTQCWLEQKDLTCAGAPYNFGLFSFRAQTCGGEAPCNFPFPNTCGRWAVKNNVAFSVTKAMLGCRVHERLRASDLRWLRESGLAEWIRRAHAGGATVLGVCGGYQMLGLGVHDPDGHESRDGFAVGLGLLEAETTLGGTKTTRVVNAALADGTPCRGYEIHLGTTSRPTPFTPFATLEDGTLDGWPMLVSSGKSPLSIAARESAARALNRGQPYDMLRPENYELWKDIEITFDPRDMARQ